MPVADFVSEYLTDEAARAVIAFRGVRYAAMGPRSAGTTATLLADSTAIGAGAAGQTVFAIGGPGALATALATAAQRLGATIWTSTEVAAIRSSDGRATGVALADGREIEAPIVVSAVDPKRTLRLVDPVALGPTMVWRTDNLRLPGVVAKVNLALVKLPRFSALAELGEAGERRLRGRIVLTGGSIDALERAFDASKYGRVSDPLVLEATIPTLVDPSLAPGGGHVLSILAQWVPYHLRERTWDADASDELLRRVLSTLEAYAPGISGLVVAQQVLTPIDLERDYGLTEGHPLHGEPALDQFFAWRPMVGLARYRLPLDGLYLAGSGAHPGGGITGGPGANAAREVLVDWRARARRR